MIIAGEASGEMYGALLSRALKSLWPDIVISGKGGTRMKEEGVKLFATISGSFGLMETIIHWRTLKKSFDKIVDTMKHERPDVLVLIDYPDFNIHLARKAKALHIPILYYVSPTVWAWRRGRARKIAELVDALALIFPFEVDIYRSLGVHCEFVGHPVLDFHELSFPPGSLTVEEARKSLGLDPSKTTLALIPGSRSMEIEKLLGLLKDTSHVLKRSHPEMQFITPQAPDIDFDLKGFDINVVKGRIGEVLIASDAAVVTSGTAALEACFFNTPTIVIYKLSLLTYLIGSAVIKVKFISIVNIMLGREVIPELIQFKATVKNIVEAVEKILGDTQYRKDMKESFMKVRGTFGPPGASLRVAKMAGKLAEW